jgi:hypothetical protein
MMFWNTHGTHGLLRQNCASHLNKVINEALRAGLDHVERPAEQKPYKTRPHAMGLKSGRNLDNIQELLSQIEGEDER